MEFLSLVATILLPYCVEAALVCMSCYQQQVPSAADGGGSGATKKPRGDGDGVVDMEAEARKGTVSTCGLQ